MKAPTTIKSALTLWVIPGLLLTAMVSQSFGTVPQINMEGSPEALDAYFKSKQRPVILSGFEETKVEADRAVITAKVKVQAHTLEEALNRNNAIRARLAYELRRAGFGEDAIHSERFSSTPSHGIFDGTQSYTTVNIVRITVESDKQFKEAAGLIDAIEELEFEGIETKHTEEEALKESARRAAMEKLDRQKQACEATLGVTLSLKYFQVYESATNPEEPVYQQRTQNRLSKSASVVAEFQVMAPPMYPIPASRGRGFGELIYTAYVEAHYEIGKEKL